MAINVTIFVLEFTFLNERKVLLTFFQEMLTSTANRRTSFHVKI